MGDGRKSSGQNDALNAVAVGALVMLATGSTQNGCMMTGGAVDDSIQGRRERA